MPLQSYKNYRTLRYLAFLGARVGFENDKDKIQQRIWLDEIRMLNKTQPWLKCIYALEQLVKRTKYIIKTIHKLTKESINKRWKQN